MAVNGTAITSIGWDLWQDQCWQDSFIDCFFHQSLWFHWQMRKWPQTTIVIALSSNTFHNMYDVFVHMLWILMSHSDTVVLVCERMKPDHNNYILYRGASITCLGLLDTAACNNVLLIVHWLINPLASANMELVSIMQEIFVSFMYTQISRPAMYVMVTSMIVAIVYDSACLAPQLWIVVKVVMHACCLLTMIGISWDMTDT